MNASAAPNINVQIGCDVHKLNPIFTQYLNQGTTNVLDMKLQSSRPVGLLFNWIDGYSTLYLMPSQRSLG